MNPKNTATKRTKVMTKDSGRKVGGSWMDPMCFPSLNWASETQQEYVCKNNRSKRTEKTFLQPAGNLRCHICRKGQIVTLCDHCGKELCTDCRKLEIWGTGAEDLSAKYFCPECKDNPDINPWGARPEEFARKDEDDQPIPREMPVTIVKTLNGHV